MPSAYIPVANITLTSDAPSVTFGSIPTAYRNLVVVSYVRGSTAGAGGTTMYMRFNGDTGGNYSAVRVTGNGSTAASSSTVSSAFFTAGEIEKATSGDLFSQVTTQISNSSSIHKSILSRSGTLVSGNLVVGTVGRWANTALVTSILIYPSANNFVAGSTFALYRIAQS